MRYYSIRLDPGSQHEKRALYRINRGLVERWVAVDRAWKKSLLFKDEGGLPRAGAVSMTPAMVKALQAYSRKMLKKNLTVSK